MLTCRIESRTDNLHLTSKQLVEIQSKYSEVKLSGHEQVAFAASSIHLQSANVQMEHLKLQQHWHHAGHGLRHHKQDKPLDKHQIAYQVSVASCAVHLLPLVSFPI